MLNGQPSTWEGDFARSDDAVEAARHIHDNFWVAWIVEMTYGSMMPSAETLLTEMRELAAEVGRDTSSFDNLESGDIELLQALMANTLARWEEEINETRPLAKCSVVEVEHLRQYRETYSREPDEKEA